MKAKSPFHSQQEFEGSLVLFSELDFREKQGFRKTRDLRIDSYSPDHEAQLPAATGERKQALRGHEERIAEELGE